MGVITEHQLVYDDTILTIKSAADNKTVIGLSRLSDKMPGAVSKTVAMEADPDELVHLAFLLVEEARQQGFSHRYLASVRDQLQNMTEPF